MTNALVVNGFEIPSYVKQYEADNTDFGSAGALPKISMKTDKSGFTLSMGGEEKVIQAPLPVVILGISPKGKTTSRAFYAHGYTPGSAEPPDCASSDGVAPNSGDSRQSESCAMCPQSAWGSGVGDGQACAQNKTIFVVPANAIDGDVFQMRIAPSSLKHLGAYGHELSKHSINKSAAITLLGYRESEPGKDYPILSFAVGGFLDEAQGTQAIERAASDEIQGLITSPAVDVTPQAALAPPAQPSPPMPPPAAAPPPPPAQPSPPMPPPATEDVDSAGNTWDARYHSAGKTKIANGTWKMKRGVKSAPASAGAAPPPDPVAPPPSAEALDNALNQWG